MSSPADLLREMDARARAIVLREADSLRLGVRTLGPQSATWRHETAIIRAASRERMRIRHALRALETPARALALLRVV